MNQQIIRWSIGLLFFNCLYAQKWDTLYIMKLSKSAVGIQQGGFTENFSFSEQLQDTTLQAQLETNLGAAMGIWLKWKKLPAIVVSFNTRSDTLVTTKGIRLTLPFVIRQRWVAKVHFSLLQGFILQYARNRESKARSAALNFSMEAFYLFNGHRFSYRYAYAYGERQLRSAGSWLVGGFFDWVAQSNPEPLWKEVPKAKYLNYSGFSANGFGIYGGGLYNWLPPYLNKNPKKRSFSMGFGGAVGIKFNALQFYPYQKSTIQGLALAMFLKAKFSIAYHLPRWIFRLSTHGDTYQYSFDTFSLKHTWSRAYIHVLYLF